MFARNLNLAIISLLLVPIIGGCSEENGNDPANGAGMGGAGLSQSGSGGFVPQAGMGGTSNQGESGSGPQTGGGPGIDSGTGDGSVVGGSGGAVVGGSGGQPVAGGDGGGLDGSCQPAAHTAGTHVVVNISWEANLGIEAGEGVLHVWAKSNLTPGEVQADGSYRFTGEALGCGSLLPPLIKSDLIGGGPTIIDIPWEVFDSPSLEPSPAGGTVSSTNVGATINIDTNITEIGISLDDPLNYTWPTSYTDDVLQSAIVDFEGDGKPGLTGIPREEGEYTLPPTTIDGAIFQTNLADRLYIVSRIIMQLTGTQDTCDSASGTATVSAFDNHVIGCRIKDTQADCTAAQTNFVDTNRTVYELHDATYQEVTLPDTATCADVRAALPAE